MNLAIITGSRADYGLLEWPIKLLREDPFFSIAEVNIWGAKADQAVQLVGAYLADAKPDYVLLLGDRFEIMGAAFAAHLMRVPIAHIGGGDVTEGSYDDAMRDCISRFASIHFCTSQPSMDRLRGLGCTRLFLVGNPGVDYIRNADWKRERPFAEPYVVVSYQAETIDGTVDLQPVLDAIGGRTALWISPNPDAGNDRIPPGETYSHAEFLNLIYHCEEFIGNSSAMLYEAPELGVKCRMIGKRQKGRVKPWGDGKASERIVQILKYGREAVDWDG